MNCVQAQPAAGGHEEAPGGALQGGQAHQALQDILQALPYNTNTIV